MTAAIALLVISSLAAPASAPNPAPELEQLGFFVGKWTCEGKAFAVPDRPEHAFKATAEIKREGGGFWQAFTYEEKASKEHPGLKVLGRWGWDAVNRRFVRAAADDHGGWDTATSPGFQGDKLVWTGELVGPLAGKTLFHHSFTKKGERQWSFALELKTPDGKWAPWNEVTCKR